MPNATRATGSATAVNAVLLSFHSIYGNYGNPSYGWNADTVIGGIGGNSFWGGGGLCGYAADENTNRAGGAADVDSGSGGGGAIKTNTVNTAGGAGGRGRCIVFEYT